MPFWDFILPPAIPPHSASCIWSWVGCLSGSPPSLGWHPSTIVLPPGCICIPIQYLDPSGNTVFRKGMYVAVRCTDFTRQKPMYWCTNVPMYWCTDVLMYWCTDLLMYYWCIKCMGCTNVLMYWCTNLLMYWFTKWVLREKSASK